MALGRHLAPVAWILQLAACASALFCALIGYQLGAVLSFALLVLSVGDTVGVNGWASRLLKAPILQWLGAKSYSLYLSHVVVLTVMIAMIGKVGAIAGIDLLRLWPVLPVSVLIFSLLIASLSSEFIERPALNWLRSWRAAQRPVDVT